MTGFGEYLGLPGGANCCGSLGSEFGELIFRSVRMSLGKHGRHRLDSFGIACQRAL
jgi:hypothetical protein